MAKVAVDSWKIAAKKTSPDISLVLLTFVYLCLVVQKPKVLEGVSDLILFVDRFTKMVTDVSTLEIGSLSRLNTRLVFK